MIVDKTGCLVRHLNSCHSVAIQKNRPQKIKDQNETNQAFLKWYCSKLLPFNIFDNEEYKFFLSTLEDKYNVISFLLNIH